MAYVVRIHYDLTRAGSRTHCHKAFFIANIKLPYPFLNGGVLLKVQLIVLNIQAVIIFSSYGAITCSVSTRYAAQKLCAIYVRTRS